MTFSKIGLWYFNSNDHYDKVNKDYLVTIFENQWFYEKRFHPPVLLRSGKLKAKWSIETAQDLYAFHHMV